MFLTLEIHVSGKPTVLMERRGRILTIGRSPDCDIALPDVDAAGIASARHAQFRLDGETLMVTDPGATNGTFLDGQRVVESQRVPLGARVEPGLSGPVGQVIEI